MIVWQLGGADEGALGFPKRALRGHSHYVQARALRGCSGAGRRLGAARRWRCCC